MERRVRLCRTIPVWLKSWLSFGLALALLSGIWYSCYWMVAKYAGNHLLCFKIGGRGAIILGILLLIFNEPIVKISMRAKRIKKREECFKLWDAVQRATPLYARPMPRIYLVPERGMNAFSFGWGLPFFSAVGATEGIVDNLSDNELAAVMAHEIGHVVNKDILVSMTMTISVMMMALTGWLLLRFGSDFHSRRGRSDKGAVTFLIIIAAGFILYVFGRLLGIILQMFVSRQREYAADATAARLMGRSQPLISALGKIIGCPHIGSNAIGAAFGFLCTADPNPDDLMSTHPTPSNRIKALERLEI